MRDDIYEKLKKHTAKVFQINTEIKEMPDNIIHLLQYKIGNPVIYDLPLKRSKVRILDPSYDRDKNIQILPLLY